MFLFLDQLLKILFKRKIKNDEILEYKNRGELKKLKLKKINLKSNNLTSISDEPKDLFKDLNQITNKRVKRMKEQKEVSKYNKDIDNSDISFSNYGREKVAKKRFKN